jgi:hypothetical protein
MEQHRRISSLLNGIILLLFVFLYVDHHRTIDFQSTQTNKTSLHPWKGIARQ